MDRANSGKQEIVVEIRTFLVAHKFSSIGPGGFDALNNTRTVLEFLNSDGLYVSIEVDRPKVVLIYFNQNRSSFSSKANDIFSELEAMLRKRWPGAVSQIIEHGDGGK